MLATLPPLAELPPADAFACALPSLRLVAVPPLADESPLTLLDDELLELLEPLGVELEVVDPLGVALEVLPPAAPPLLSAAESPPMAAAPAVLEAEPPLALPEVLLFEPEPPFPPVRARTTLLYAVLHWESWFDCVLLLLPELLATAPFDWVVLPCVDEGVLVTVVLPELFPFDCEASVFVVVFVVDVDVELPEPSPLVAARAELVPAASANAATTVTVEILLLRK